MKELVKGSGVYVHYQQKFALKTAEVSIILTHVN
jgi:hypothetical protein